MSSTSFSDRHIGPRGSEIAKMLAEVGASSLADLLDQTVPVGIRTQGPLRLRPAASESQALAELAEIASDNTVVTSLIGLGYHDTIIPPVILRNVLESPAWYTAYTPYQPEISQGRLEALLNFQTMISDLTGLEIANASLLDEPTAAAEAMAMCRRIDRTDRPVFFADDDCHPQTLAVLRTRAEPVGIKVETADLMDDSIGIEQAFGLLVQYPGSKGSIHDYIGLIERAKKAGVLVVIAADPLALVLLRSPGELGADIAVGSAQRFGVPLGYGGPHAGYMATKAVHVRALPGRLVGVSHDAAGRTGLRLALQTREQHIRRERATSNVCTAQVLLAVMAGLYACWHGPEGLKEIARRTHRLTSDLAARLRGAGIGVVNQTWFDTLTVEVPDAGLVVEAALEQGLNLRRIDRSQVGITLDETTTPEIVDRVLSVFGVHGETPEAVSGIPSECLRTDDILSHPVFNSYHSEHEMLRYLRRLSDLDLALDRTMIPLGSCTMKLNATAEMLPITWPEFTNLHPFAPPQQARGYRRLMSELAADLADITGYDAVSLQPNAGSQGELAGLLAIRAYHRANGDSERDICLIPASAHGTNAASAAMAGLRVVVIGTDDEGNVDLDELRSKVEAHADRLAAIMVTYPSTHGVFEETLTEICELVHRAGGQVYVDGANLNALVGVSRLGEIGADVSHLNLHKTFTIPHGGGGPGVGPIGVRAHLAPFLPNHPLDPDAGPESGIGPISGAPYGSAGILGIPWMYLRMMGPEGMVRASEVAILAANYVASRLAAHFPVLYTGRNGRVAHECIIDIRPIARSSGITAEDVAKRLADYCFHAPTLSFPVAGTLMIEPTESESLAELDRFCDAMISIRNEIRRVEDGEWPEDDNPLVNAPHTAADLITDRWDHPYTRAEATYPVAWLQHRVYFPPVGRIDSAAGDRNLMCTCPPIGAYAE